MEQVSDEIGAEYARIVARAKEDPGTAGDEGEENWARVLRGWLPPGYHVVTKGRLLSTAGEASPQLDVLVLHPAYPPALRDKKVYLASGVAAAFECKLTLRPNHIAEAVRTSCELRRLQPPRSGSPYRELHSAPAYGLLAHSHVWTAENAQPVSNVSRHLWTADYAEVAHPREMLDVLCVADLATWSSSRMPFIGPSLAQPWSEHLASLYGADGSATTTYFGPADHGSGPGNPLGVMIAKVLQRLAWEDPSIRPIADYWRLAGLWGSGEGAHRSWDPRKVYSPEVVPSVIAGALVNGEAWNEWSMAF
jgi:Domain of unknown function (DUF6602)